MKKEVKIVIADDHPIFREGLVKIMETNKSFKVVKTFGNGNEAMEYISLHKPDIAILDISMPGYSGLDIAKIINEMQLPTLSIILTMYNEEEYLEEALESGVKGYLLKDATMTEIMDCINNLLSGGYFISKELTNKLIKGINTVHKTEVIIDKINKLTPTEKQIIKFLSQNKTSTQIAEEMFISYRTVQNHRLNITHKLGLSGHNSLLIFATENRAKL